MLAFPGMLVGVAEDAGMLVPPDPDNFDREAFPHFFIFTELQLGRRMSSPSEHSDNAKVIAPIPVDRLKTMTLQDFIDAGLQLC